MQLIKYSKNKDWSKILQRTAFDSSSLEKKVRKILDAVKDKGDKSVRRFTEEFDGVRMNNFLATRAEFEEAGKLLFEELKNAIRVAKNNIEQFHATQLKPV